MFSLPDFSGAYAVEMVLFEPRPIKIGRFGKINFHKGTYIYSGSALGPGGLSARLGRHMPTKSKKPHWHIDYLSDITQTRACCYIPAIAGIKNGKPVECSWSQALLSLPGAAVPVRGFGASDCTSTCPAHLIYFPIDSLHANGDGPILLQGVVRTALADAIEAPLEDLVSAAL